MPDSEEQPLTCGMLMQALKIVREEDQKQRKQDLQEIMEKLSQQQEAAEAELREEFNEKFRCLSEELDAVKVHVTAMGGSTFVERVEEMEARVNKPSNPGPSEPGLPSTRDPISQTNAPSTPPPKHTSTSHNVPSVLQQPPRERFSNPFYGRPSITPTHYFGKTPLRRYSLQLDAVSRATAVGKRRRASLKGSRLARPPETAPTIHPTTNTHTETPTATTPKKRPENTERRLTVNYGTLAPGSEGRR